MRIYFYKSDLILPHLATILFPQQLLLLLQSSTILNLQTYKFHLPYNINISCFYYNNKTFLKQDFLKNNLYTNYYNNIILGYDSDSFSFLACSTISWAIWEGTSSKCENFIVKVPLPWVIERKSIEYLNISA